MYTAIQAQQVTLALFSYRLLTAMTFHYVSLGICFCFDFWVPDVAVCTGPGFTEISPLRINSLCVALELL